MARQSDQLSPVVAVARLDQKNSMDRESGRDELNAVAAVTNHSVAKRVLFVEGNVDGTIGGSYYSLLYLASGLDRSRYEPIVVFASDNALIPRFHCADIRTIVRPPRGAVVVRNAVSRFLARAIHFFRGWLIEPIQLAALLKQNGISLVHLNNSILRNHSWVIAGLFARIPCITHERGINRVFPLRAQVLARSLAAVICISRAVHDNFVSGGLANLKLVTIHNGLDPEEMRVNKSSTDVRKEFGIAPDARLIGVVGNIKQWKGQEVVVHAMAKVRERIPDLVCLLIGDTPPGDPTYRVHILRLISDLGLRDRVLLTGFRRDVANYVAALEILVHASVSPEPFGRVLLEGMALGKPLVASNDGAVPEIVVDGETGLLFDPGDAASLADRLIKLLEDNALLARMGKAGRARVLRDFSIAHNVLATQAVYDRVLSRG